MRQNIADRTTFDSSMIPSDQALYFHWKRACWVIHMWSQADSHNMVLEPITEYGWSVHNDQLRVVWDTDENMAAVRDRVNVLLKGCKCASGCQNRRCAEGRTQCVLKAVNAQIAKTAQTPIVPHKQRKVMTC